MTTKQKSKESTNAKKEKCMRSQRSSYERTLLDLSLKSEDCLLHTEVYFRTASAGFQSQFFSFLEQDWTLLPRVSTDGNTADILMLMLMLMHDRFTHTTKQHKHKLISIRKWKIFHFLMLICLCLYRTGSLLQFLCLCLCGNAYAYVAV